MSSPVGGFMPIPLAMMIPFMGAQSMVMGDAFGKGFQFGKRKISALSNEEFNKLDMSAMITEFQQEFKNLVPTIQQSIVESKDLQNTIIKEMIKILPEFLAFLSGTITATSQPSIQKEQSPFETTVKGTVGTTGTTGKRPTTKTTREIDSATRNKLMQHYRNAIHQLEEAIVKRLRGFNAKESAKLEFERDFRSGGRPFTTTMLPAYRELDKQKQYLANVTAWKKPY